MPRYLPFSGSGKTAESNMVYTQSRSKKQMSVIHILLLLAFMAVVMIDPTNEMFHLKEVVFVGLMCFFIATGKTLFYKDQARYIGMLFSAAIISVLMGLFFFNSDISYCFSYFKALLFLFIAMALSKFSNEDLLKYCFYVGFALSIYIVVLFISMTSGLFSLSAFIDKAYNADHTLMIASRDFLGIEIFMFFYKTMPFCFFALAYALRENKIIPACIIVVSIVLGGSRTPMLMTMVIIAYIISSKSKKLFKYLLPIAFVFGILFVLTSLLSSNNRQDGDDLKFKIINYFLNNSSVFGHGVGTPFYIAERGMVSNTEVTYFEMIYQYGYFLFPLVVYIFFSPAFIILRKNETIKEKDFAVTYLLYLINAGTNPLLISSTGMFVYACALTIMSKVNEHNRANRLLKYKQIIENNDSNTTCHL